MTSYLPYHYVIDVKWDDSLLKDSTSAVINLIQEDTKDYESLLSEARNLIKNADETIQNVLRAT